MTYNPGSKFMEMVEKCGPLETSILACSEIPKPPAPLRPGHYVRETELDRNGHKSRRKYGTVSQVRGLMVGVMFRGEGIEAWVFPDELEAVERKPKGASRKRLERENRMLRTVVAAVVESRRKLARRDRIGELEPFWDKAHAEYTIACIDANKALAPFELEPT